MGENSAISWCDHTFNPWTGCQKVSPGCAHCYAERLVQRFSKGANLWGPKGARQIAGPEYWNAPLVWHRRALKTGRLRVFCASMADVFEDRQDLREPRARLWDLIAATSMLDWLILTKRPENVRRMVPWSDLNPWPRHVWLGVSVEDQDYAERRIPRLLDIPAAVRFVSYEPALGPVEWHEAWAAGLHWIIVGGESGPGFRPFDMAWARATRDWCWPHGVPFYFKQDASIASETRPWLVEEDGSCWTWKQLPGDRRAPDLVKAAAVQQPVGGPVQLTLF